MKKEKHIIELFLNKIDNILDRIKNNKLLLYLIVLLGLFVIYYFNMKDKIRNSGIDNNYSTKYLIYGSIVTIISFFLIIFINKTKIVKLHLLYIIISLLLGCIYIFCMPLFTQSDEPSHYLKAYSVAMGRINFNGKNGTSDYMYPEVVKKSVYYNFDADKKREYKTYEDMENIRKLDPNYESEIYVKIDDWVANYPSINYLPHVIGMKIGMLFNLNSYYIGILGRITNLIICTLLIALGLKWLPYKKNAALVFLLSPVVISYNAAFSIDGAILCYSFLFISYILKVRHEKNKLNLNSYLLLMLLAILISITKFAYLPIIGTIFLIPKDSFKGKNKKIIFSIMLLLIGMVSTYLCLKMMNIGITSNSKYNNSWIIHYPVRLLYVFINSAFIDCYNYISNLFAGNYLCHGQLEPYSLISFTYILLFILSIFSEEKKDSFRNVEKMLLIIIIMAVYFMLFFAMYLANSPINSSIAIGVQGRYFIPILILFVLLFDNKKNTFKPKFFINLSIVLNLSIILTMIVKFMFFVY